MDSEIWWDEVRIAFAAERGSFWAAAMAEVRALSRATFCAAAVRALAAAAAFAWAALAAAAAFAWAALVAAASAAAFAPALASASAWAFALSAALCEFTPARSCEMRAPSETLWWAYCAACAIAEALSVKGSDSATASLALTPTAPVPTRARASPAVTAGRRATPAARVRGASEGRAWRPR